MALTQPCFTNLTPDQQNFNIYEQLSQIAGFEIPAYDEIDITYYGVTNNIATVVYSNSGSSVATLTLTYSVQPPTTNDANLVNVTIS
jgi:alanine dehydrogenase